MKGVIRLNNPLISGGKVTKASGADFMGQPVALKMILRSVRSIKGRSQSLNVTQPGPCMAVGLW